MDSPEQYLYIDVAPTSATSSILPLLSVDCFYFSVVSTFVILFFVLVD